MVAAAWAGSVGKRPEAMAYARVARFSFKDRKGGIGPRQRSLMFDLKHRRDGRAAVNGKTYICGFIADRNRVQMRGAGHCQRNCAVDDRAYQAFRRNVDEQIF